MPTRPRGPGARPRVTVRDEPASALRHDDLEVTPVARVYEAGIAGRAFAVGGSLARPRRVEVRRDGVLHGSIAVPDWNLRIAVGALAVAGAAWIIRRSMP